MEQAEGPVAATETTKRTRRSERFWDNYDLEQSYKPELVPPEVWKAITALQRRARAWLAKRSRARRAVAEDLDVLEREAERIQRAWRRRVACEAVAAAKVRRAEEAVAWASSAPPRG